MSKERVRLIKLKEVMEEFILRRKGLVSDEDIRKLYYYHDWKQDFEKELFSIELQKQVRISSDYANRKEIEAEANREILQFFQGVKP